MERLTIPGVPPGMVPALGSPSNGDGEPLVMVNNQPTPVPVATFMVLADIQGLLIKIVEHLEKQGSPSDDGRAV